MSMGSSARTVASEETSSTTRERMWPYGRGDMVFSSGTVFVRGARSFALPCRVAAKRRGVNSGSHVIAFDDGPVDVDPETGAVGGGNDGTVDAQRVLRDRELVVVWSQNVAGVLFDLHAECADDEVTHGGGGDVP